MLKKAVSLCVVLALASAAIPVVHADGLYYFQNFDNITLDNYSLAASTDIYGMQSGSTGAVTLTVMKDKVDNVTTEQENVLKVRTTSNSRALFLIPYGETSPGTWGNMAPLNNTTAAVGFKVKFTDDPTSTDEVIQFSNGSVNIALMSLNHTTKEFTCGGKTIGFEKNKWLEFSFIFTLDSVGGHKADVYFNGGIVQEDWFPATGNNKIDLAQLRLRFNYSTSANQSYYLDDILWQAPAYSHPGGLYTQAQFDGVKAKAQAGTQPWQGRL